MLNFKEIAILSGEQTKNKIRCKFCGHPQLLGKQDKIICKECGHYIFKNEETEFEYRTKEQIIKMLKRQKQQVLANKLLDEIKRYERK